MKNGLLRLLDGLNITFFKLRFGGGTGANETGSKVVREKDGGGSRGEKRSFEDEVDSGSGCIGDGN